jgi:hypothetical protein
MPAGGPYTYVGRNFHSFFDRIVITSAEGDKVVLEVRHIIIDQKD